MDLEKIKYKKNRLRLNMELKSRKARDFDKRSLLCLQQQELHNSYIALVWNLYLFPSQKEVNHTQNCYENITLQQSRIKKW